MPKAPEVLQPLLFQLQRDLHPSEPTLSAFRPQLGQRAGWCPARAGDSVAAAAASLGAKAQVESCMDPSSEPTSPSWFCLSYNNQLPFIHQWIIIQRLLGTGDNSNKQDRQRSLRAKKFTFQRGLPPISKKASSFQNVGNVRKRINGGMHRVIAVCVVYVCKFFSTYVIFPSIEVEFNF